MELIAEFENFRDWEAWKVANAAAIADFEAIDIEATLKLKGVSSSIFGPIPPQQVVIKSKNYRESIIVRKLNSRQRALLEILARNPTLWNNPNSSFYAAEAITPFAMYMRGRFSRFLGSEYTDDPDRARALFPIVIEDLNRLSYPDRSFDCAVTNDVLEHVPSIKVAIAELRRILKPGGILLSTFPFTDRETSNVKAELMYDKILYHTEPEYHGNPVDPKGSLVFTVPGWDILDTVRNAGFKTAKIIKLASVPKAIRGGKSPFIEVLYAEN